METNKCRPFLRWAGGKRWLAPTLAPIIKKRLKENTYFEPFLGSAAMFFSIQPDKAHISDLNQELINSFIQIKQNWERLLKEIIDWPITKDFYYQLRTNSFNDPVKRAARFIYLNRTCYGGLYRENLKGVFNVPYGGGDRNTNLLRSGEIFKNASLTLNKDITIKHSDYKNIFAEPQKGDVLYLDPVYSSVTTKQFDRYGAIKFTWEDQIKIAKCSYELMQKGVLIIISNSFTKEIEDLYPFAYQIELSKKKSIGNKANDTNTHKEYLLVCDPKKQKKSWERIGPIRNRLSITFPKEYS